MPISPDRKNRLPDYQQIIENSSVGISASKDPEGKHDCVFKPEETKVSPELQIPALDNKGLPLGDGDGGLVFIHPPTKGKDTLPSGV